MAFPQLHQQLARVRTRVNAWLAAATVCATALVVAACGSGNVAGSTSTTSSSSGSTTLAVVQPVIDCSKLASIDITDIGGSGSSITSATVQSVTTNGTSANLCVVKGTLAPSNTFEVALPVSTWTQRFAEIGCGGLCGTLTDPSQQSSVSFSYDCPLVQQTGLVTAATDMGHSSSSTTWTTNTQQQADFAYRGQHITTLAAKKLIQAYYGQTQKYSYFIGCSDGGREALMAAQRYPNDYNGIIAGAPAAHFTIQNSLYHGWNFESNSTTGIPADDPPAGTSGNAIMYADTVSILHKAILDACSGDSGAADSLITDPRTCSFSPVQITCNGANAGSCLTSAQVIAASQIYSGPLDATSGEHMLAGSPQLGSEFNWPGLETPSTDSTAGAVAVTTQMNYGIVTGAYNLIFSGDSTIPTIDSFGYADASFYSSYLAKNHALYDATNPDLSAFQKAGGKLILWHGWADQHISPRFTIQYYEAMQNTMGASTVQQFVRMYLVPGVGHCGGGEGFANIDLVSKITGWVEQGTAPDAVMSYQTNDDNSGTTVTASRPIYPYPAIPQYSGSGDWHDGANWVEGAPHYTLTTQEWAGQSFYTPYTATTQGVAAP